jgi:hypothetical protein
MLRQPSGHQPVAASDVKVAGPSGRKPTQTMNKLKIETYISLRMRSNKHLELDSAVANELGWGLKINKSDGE